MFADEIGKLRKIQHLALIRDEEACVGSGMQGESLSAKMGALVAKLDGEALAVLPEAPRGDLQDVRGRGEAAVRPRRR